MRNKISILWIKETIKKSIIWAVVFFFTILILSVGYALVGWLSTADKVWTGSGLTSTSWNRIVDWILDLDSRTSGITTTGITRDTFTSNVWWSNITPESWWTTTNITCRRIWSFLQIRKHANYTAGNITPAWSTLIWTLPAECRPSVGIYIPSTCWTTGNVTTACLSFIDVDGKVYIYNSSSMYYISFAWTYPAN